MGDDSVPKQRKQLIIGFKPGTRRSTCLNTHKQLHGQLMDEIKQIGAHVITVPEQELQSCMRNYTACSHVRYVEEDQQITADVIPSDPLINEQWGLQNQNVVNAWGQVQAGVLNSMASKLAVLDSGIDSTHEDLRGKIILNQNFTDSPASGDLYGHGTHVAAIAAAITNNRRGMAGISYNTAGIMNIKVLGDTGGGTVSNVVRGIIYAADQGADVINLSLGGQVDNESMRQAVVYAFNKGVFLVGSAGNSATSSEHYPAAYSQVMAVAATNETNEIAPFSNYGRWVELAAPGQNILSAYSRQSNRGESYGTASGTSQAAPFVSGLAALLKAVNNQLTNRDIRMILQQSSVSLSLSNKSVRFGRVNANKAVQLTSDFMNDARTNKPNIPRVWLNIK